MADRASQYRLYKEINAAYNIQTDHDDEAKDENQMALAINDISELLSELEDKSGYLEIYSKKGLKN